MVNQKIELTAQALVERLNMRCATAADPVPASKSYTSDVAGTGQDAIVTLSFPGAAGGVDSSVEAIIKFMPYPALASGAKDALGLPQNVYSPHVAKVLIDTAAAGAITRFNELMVLGELFRIGMRVELYTLDPSGRSVSSRFIVPADFPDKAGTATFVAAFESLEWAGLASV